MARVKAKPQTAVMVAHELLFVSASWAMAPNPNITRIAVPTNSAAAFRSCHATLTTEIKATITKKKKMWFFVVRPETNAK